MANWDVEKLLDHTQELVGDAVGNFFNISTRLQLLNQAQRELVEETRAITSSSSITITSGTRDYSLPTDFLTFSPETASFVNSGGTYYPVAVVDTAWLDRVAPGWQDADLTTGTPKWMVLRNETLTLYPTPDTSGTLELPYVVDPTELTDMDDVPFNGISRLNRYAIALAYRAAFITTLSRAPQLAGFFQDLYEKQERLMRHHVRSNPQNKPGIRPPGD